MYTRPDEFMNHNSAHPPLFGFEWSQPLVCNILSRREGNAHKRRTMQTWKHALDKVWATRPIEGTRMIIDRQPNIMKTIIDCDGGPALY